MQYFPLNMKLSYNQRLDIQLFIRHQLQSQKFKRHWIFCKGYEPAEQNRILKTYLSFINQGDLYRVKTSNYAGKWKEKTFQDIVTLLQKQQVIGQRKKYKLDLQRQFVSIQQQASQKQYDQIIVVTIFLSETISQRKVQQFSEFLKTFESSQVILNLFIPEQLYEKILPTKTWLHFYSQKDLKQQVRGLFGVLSKAMFKKVTVELKCLDGDIVINENTQQLAKNSWKGQKSPDCQNSFISNTIYFPSSNSPYIMSAEIKNLLKQQVCQFEMVLRYEDETGKVGQLSKLFSLKPIKQFMDWTENQPQNQPLYKYQQLSLSFEEVNLNQKLNFMKIIGTPVRVLLKSRNEV